MRTEQETYEADKQLGHLLRLGGILAKTTNRNSLYNYQYGVFARDNSIDPHDRSLVWCFVLWKLGVSLMDESGDRESHELSH